MEIMYAANLSTWENLFPSLWSIETGLPIACESLHLGLVSKHTDGIHSKGLRWRDVG